MPVNSETKNPHYQTALNTIYTALADLNTQLPKGRRIEQLPDTRLFGAEGALDSMELCNFIIIAEQKLKDTFGVSVDLTRDDPFSPHNGHFKTVDSLATHVAGLLQEHSSE